ncbi:MAG: hypothetical protein ABIP91_04690 [Sphingomicrobium sp.]
MRNVMMWGLAIAAAGCAPAPEIANGGPGAIVEAWAPTGARIEPSGFATVEQAPPSPVPAMQPDANRPRDECGYYARLAGISDAEAADRLAYFPREVGLGVDAEGYLAIVARDGAGTVIGRVGEEFNWGGPIGISEDAPMVAELRAQCGNAPIEHVGMLTSTRAFKQRYGG